MVFVLVLYDPNKPCDVWYDTSNHTVRTVLIWQDSVDGLWKLVEFLSKLLKATEYSYSITKREFVGFTKAL